MNLSAVMDEIAACVDQIAGLRVYAYPPGTVSPPAAVVSYPTEIQFQLTGGRGHARMSIPLAVALGRPTDRGTRDRLNAYLAGGGASSIAKLLDDYAWTSCSAVTALTADVDYVEIGSVPYLAALFTLEVIGQGTT